MMKSLFPRLKLACLLTLCGLAPSAAATPLDWASLPLPGIKGAPLSPNLFEGKVVLVVNTASQCGFTPQYDGLESLWTRYRERGFVILGIPSNDFGGQEPGSNEEVATFCRVNYGVDFPLLEKQTVVGPDAHPFYRWAKEQTGVVGVPRWNFHKILIGRDGRLVDWFSSVTGPATNRLNEAIEGALSQSVAAKTGLSP